MIERSRSGSHYIRQAGYIKKVLERFGMERSKPVAKPLEKQTLRKRRPNETSVNQLQYKEAFGSLQYTVTVSWPDISYATGKIARYAENTLLIYWVELERILRYLRGTVMT